MSLARPSDAVTAASSPHSIRSTSPLAPCAAPLTACWIGWRSTGPADPFHAAASVRSGVRPCAAMSAVIVSGSIPAWVAGRRRRALVPPTSSAASRAAVVASVAAVPRASGARFSSPARPETRIGWAPPDQAASISRVRAREAPGAPAERGSVRIRAATVMPKVYAGAKRARIFI